MHAPTNNASWDRIELQDWTRSFEELIHARGLSRAHEMLRALQIHGQRHGVPLPVTSTTPYVNTIPVAKQPEYPGDYELEWQLRSLVRWNAMAMVVRANRRDTSIGGHISTYASAATLYEVGFNHFFRGPDNGHPGDLVYFQGHASPGIYARAFLEGRLSEQHLHNFRRELAPQGGLSSYPHPWLMPNFWQFPTVSMGLGPLTALYQARFLRYLHDRGLADTSKIKVWAFLGDGECDEPESLGSISLAAREELDNLIFVINCNLQRLDGPVRGNGKIIQELEAVFRGVGWNVIKVVFGNNWDPIFKKDHEGILTQRLTELVDGHYLKYAVSDGAYIRKHLCNGNPRLEQILADVSDAQLPKLRRGGHDPQKVYAAYHAAARQEGAPTVILAKTIKGYGLGEAGEGRNVTHQQKKLNDEELLKFRDRFKIPLSDEDVGEAPFYRPPDDSPVIQYLHERRRALGGYLPQRNTSRTVLSAPRNETFDEFFKGTEGREASTTMAFVRMLSKLTRDENLGRHIVPIVADEARTFGMESLFRQIGIYSHAGQQYEPVDRESLLYYREAVDGQIVEEGITEAGAISTFIAAGTSDATLGTPTIPFFTFYSMFGPQRVGDLIWAAADQRVRGFLIGATSGRTTLNGEGLQHQDGHSHLFACAVPNLKAYDPAYAFELAVILRDGLRRMYEAGESVFYYITVNNENYAQPPIPEGGHEKGILRGLYKFKAAPGKSGKRAHLLASGALVNEALKAQELLGESFGVAADVWSATSYKELHLDALSCERWNRLHPLEQPRTPYVVQCLGAAEGALVAVSDYVKAMPTLITPWLPRRMTTLGTDGFGRSDSREALRSHFEVDAHHIAIAALFELARDGVIERNEVARAIEKWEIDPEKSEPAKA